MAADLSIEKLPPEAWPAVMGLCARAFFDEPFVHELFGPDPVVRFAGIHALYASGTPDEQDVWLGAVAGTALVAKGYVQASDIEPVIGALLTIGSVVWSVADKRVRQQ